MKKITSVFASLLFSLFLSAQVIPNAGFENWSNNNESTTTYLVPQSWITVDVLQTYLSDLFGDSTYTVNSVSRVGNAHSGSYAVQLKVDIDDSGMDTVGGSVFSIPSAASFFDYAFGGSSAGFTSSTRPASLKGFYKKNTLGNDQALCFISMTKWNTVTNHRDTLMYDENISFPANATNWTAFTFPLTYAYNENPDTVLIGFGLDTPGSFNMASTLTIDDLSFFGNIPIGMNEEPGTPVSAELYPNPVSSMATIQVSGIQLQNASIEIYDLLGNKVTAQQGLSGNTIAISREGLQKGLYFYNIVQGNSVLTSGKFIVE